MLEVGKTYFYDWGSNVAYYYVKDIKDKYPYCIFFNIYKNVLVYDFNHKFKNIGTRGLSEIDSRDMLKLIFKQEIFQPWV